MSVRGAYLKLDTMRTCSSLGPFERITRIKIVLAMAMAVCAACSYTSSFADCQVTCTESTGCPDGFTCATSEGLCRSGATAASCAAVLDGGADAGTDEDAAVDGPTNPCAGVTLPPACAAGTPFVCNRTCHVICTDAKDWDGAKAACEGASGWWLTEIDYVAEDLCVDGQVPDGTDTWIGLRQAEGQTAVDANWSWRHSGAVLPPLSVPQPTTPYRHWESETGSGSAPNDAGGASGEDGSQNCASTSGDNSGWDDRECSQAIPYVCERFP